MMRSQAILLSSAARCRLETGRLRILLGAEPAAAPRGLHAAALVVRCARQHIDAIAVPYQALDRTPVGSAALGLLPGLGAIFRRPFGFAAHPQAGLGAPRLPLPR